jgi:Rha family phage regulatory protein
MTFEDMPSPEGDSNPVVFIDYGQVRATSLDVAAYFGKRHADVVRSIRALLEAEPGFNERTFALIECVDDRGRRQPAFTMNRDGFTLVAMGFTGPNALRFKWAYIQAFNQMESQLHTSQGVGVAPSLAHREFPDWPLDEMRTKKGVTDMYRMAYGPLSAQWIMPQLGFPTPPETMIELGRQLLLNLIGGGPKEPKKVG